MSEVVTFQTTMIAIREWGNACFIIVPEAIAADFASKGVRRVVCMVNGGAHFHCGLNKTKKHGYFIMFSKARQKAADIGVKDQLEVTLLPDESKYGFPMPEEWEEVLAIDEDAAEIFQTLTPGRQRNILHMIGSAKREETRINRALLIAENLKMGARESNEFMKK